MKWVRLSRPFTLLPPLLGMLSGAASAYGVGAAASLATGRIWFLVLSGAAMASLLNAASNVLNQVCDLELDRINKPERPLPRGEVTVRGASIFSAALYGASITLAYFVIPGTFPEVFVIVVFTAFLTWSYSARPLRLRRIWWLAPLVIALPRGGLLKVCGWATLAPVAADREPWLLGGLFFLFILGAASTKDFEDVEGDRRGGVVTLPVRFGARRAAVIMAPFYVLPWVLLVVLANTGALSLDPLLASGLGLFLAIHGGVTAAQMIRRADDLVGGPHGRRAWRNLYLLMMEAQVGVGLLYLIP